MSEPRATSQRAQELQSIVETIWSTLLGIPIDCIDLAVPAPSNGDYCARVEIAGTWDGVLEVTCSEGLARFVGAALFQCDPWDLDEESSLEAVLELANMIGGNVKALVGEGNRLGLPQAVEDRAARVQGPCEAALLFDCLGEPLALELRRAAA